MHSSIHTFTTSSLSLFSITHMCIFLLKNSHNLLQGLSDGEDLYDEALLPKIAAHVEIQLFEQATTLESYHDFNTLLERLDDVVNDVVAKMSKMFSQMAAVDSKLEKLTEFFTTCDKEAYPVNLLDNEDMKKLGFNTIYLKKAKIELFQAKKKCELP